VQNNICHQAWFFTQNITKNWLFICVLMLPFLAKTQTAMSPEQVVQANLDAYNARDIERFMHSFAPEIEMYNFNDGKLMAKGLVAVRELYRELFELSPKLHSTIKQRIVFDNKVIDHEYIVGRRGSDAPIEMVLIYEVLGEKIVKTIAMRKQ
jgi:hypothetical protein